MKMIIMAASVVALLPAAAWGQEPEWTVGGTLGVVSDYRDRGYTLSDGEPVVQADVTVAHGSGLYAGVWASGIDEYGVGPDGDGAEVEITVYGGRAWDVAGFEIDLGIWGNFYPDGDAVNYVEFPVQIGRTLGATTLSAGAVWAPSQTGTGDEANLWVWTRARYAPESWPVSLHATLGHEDGGFAPDGKTDWRLGVEAPFGPVTLGLDWVDSDTEDSALVARLNWGWTL